MMINDAIGILTHGAAVTFMIRLGAARFLPFPDAPCERSKVA
jgi:hypothetical protein